MEQQRQPVEKVRIVDPASPVHNELGEVVERGFYAGTKVRLVRKPVNWASDTAWFRNDQVRPA